MSRQTKTRFSSLSLAGLFFLIAGNLAVFIPLCLGWSYEIVKSDSMQPTIAKNDLALVRPIKTDAIQPGDVMLYETRVGQRPVRVLHRVDRMTANASTAGGWDIVMKGDANDQPDEKIVTAGQFRGEYALRLPLVGYAVSFVRDYYILIIGALAVLLTAKLALSWTAPAPRRRSQRAYEPTM